MHVHKYILAGALTLIVICSICGAGCILSDSQQSSATSDENTTVMQIAHRGLSSEAPENTLAAFRLAGENGGAWGIECDIFKSADGVFIVTHDDSMMRMCGVDKNVTELSAAEIQTYPVISGNGIETYPNEVFPTLEEYLNVVQSYPPAYAVIEIKVDPFTDEDAKNLLDLCKAYLSADRLCIIAEDKNALLKLKRLDDSLKFQWIGDDYSMNETAVQWCIDNAIDMDINCSLATSGLADRLHEASLGLNVWTVNEEDLARQMVLDIGVDYLTSNYIFSASVFLES